MMNEQRAFWISGLGSLAVVVLLGSALWARSKPVEPNFSALAPVSASAGVPDQRPPDQDPLRKELEGAYSDLDTAYREIESLRATSAGPGEGDHDDDDREGDDREGDDREGDDREGDDREGDDHEGDDHDDEERRGDRYASESEEQQ